MQAGREIFGPLIFPEWFKLNWRVWMALLRSHCNILFELKSRFWLGHSQNLDFISSSHSEVKLLECFELLYKPNVLCGHKLKAWYYPLGFLVNIQFIQVQKWQRSLSAIFTTRFEWKHVLFEQDDQYKSLKDDQYKSVCLCGVQFHTRKDGEAGLNTRGDN